MKRFQVFATIMVPMATHVEVDAENVEDAVEQAKIKFVEEAQLIDGDGNTIDLLSDDVTIDQVDEIIDGAVSIAFDSKGQNKEDANGE